MNSKIFQWKDGIPCKADGDDGDSLLWAGLLYAASGGFEYSVGITNSMDSDGRFWRSPSRVGVHKVNSFSRDMSVGLLLAAAKDKSSNKEFGINGYYLEKWVSYVKGSGNKTCPEATDSRNKMTPAVWWRIAYIRPDIVPWYYRCTRYLLKPYLYVAAETCRPGYHRHLIACTILMFYVLQGGRDSIGWLKATAQKLSEDEPNNPFFSWLDLDNEAAAARFKEIETKYPMLNSLGTQWAWERTDSEEAYKNSCGHDRDFLTHLISGGLK